MYLCVPQCTQTVLNVQHCMHRTTHMLRFERQTVHLGRIRPALQHHSILHFSLHLLALPFYPLHHKPNINIVLALRHIHPASLIAIPPAAGQKRLQQVVVVAVERDIDARGATPLQERIGAAARLLRTHAEARPTVALVGGVARNRAHRASKVRLQQRGVAQRRGQRRRHERRVPRRQRRVPRWLRAARDHRERRPAVEVCLPVREVERRIQRVPPQHACQARAELRRVGRRDVRVGLFVQF